MATKKQWLFTIATLTSDTGTSSCLVTDTGAPLLNWHRGTIDPTDLWFWPLTQGQNSSHWPGRGWYHFSHQRRGTFLPSDLWHTYNLPPIDTGASFYLLTSSQEEYASQWHKGQFISDARAPFLLVTSDMRHHLSVLWHRSTILDPDPWHKSTIPHTDTGVPNLSMGHSLLLLTTGTDTLTFFYNNGHRDISYFHWPLMERHVLLPLMQ